MIGGTDPMCLHGVIPQGQCAKCFPTPDPAYYDMERSRMVSAKERRERIATAIAAGLLGYPDQRVCDSGEYANFALEAVTIADALIRELDK